MKDKKIEQYLIKTKKEFDKFFQVKINLPRVLLIDSRKDFDKIRGEKTPRWACGNYMNKTISLFKPEVFEKETCHKKEDFWSVLKHELVHAYFSEITDTEYPSWLDEGLAAYLAGQRKNIDKKEIVKMIDYFKKHDKYVYQSVELVGFLIDKYGKKKILDLLRTINNKTTKKEFNNNFKKIYGFELNKKELLRRLE